MKGCALMLLFAAVVVGSIAYEVVKFAAWCRVAFG
jgi:hypothetical protein